MVPTTFKAIIVFAALAATLEASSLFAGGQCTGRGTLQGQNDFQQTSVPGQFATAVLGDNNCVSSGSATYSMFKIGSSTNVFSFPQNATGTWIEGSAWAEVQIGFGLTDSSLPANTPGTIYLPINYDVTLAAGIGHVSGVSSAANFGIQDPGNPFSPLLRLVSGDDVNGNNCPTPAASIPACNGRYQGTVLYGINVTYNSTGPGGFSGRVYLRFDAASLNGSSDALHTITFGNIIIPSTVGFFYDTEVGNANPMGFTTAPTAQAVPEPGTLAFLALGLLALTLPPMRDSLTRPKAIRPNPLI